MNIISIGSDHLNFVSSFEKAGIIKPDWNYFIQRISDEKKSDKRRLQLFITRSR